MTTYDYDSPAGSAGGGMTDQAQQAASTAKDEAQNVAAVAKDEAQNLAGEARQHAGNLVDEARRQVEDQSRSQLDRLVGSLTELADDLERMARGEGAGSGMAQTLVTEVSDRARSISSQVQGREPSEVLDQVRGFARRKPGTFLLGALAAGVVAGRLTRAAKDAGGSSSGSSTSTPSGLGTPGTSSTPGTAGSVTTQPGPVGTEGLASSGPGLASPVQDTGTAGADPLAGTATPDHPVYPEGSETSTTAWGTPANPTGGPA
jgi:hypothetical protein